MKRGMHRALLALGMVVAVLPLRAQIAASRSVPPAQLEVTLAYTADRGTGSGGTPFWMQGGKAEFAIALTRGLSLTGEVGALHVSNINSANQNLGMVSYLVGPRYSFRYSHRYTPFVQALVGGVHGFDAYFPTTNGSGITPDALAFAAGGGVNIAISRHLSIRPVQVDYFQTQLPNNTTGRENNLRMGAGLVFLISPQN